MSLLTIETLSLSIGTTPVLNDVSLTLEAGRILGIIGESGSGKSMTALSVMQLLPDAAHMQGRVQFAGQELSGISEASMCRVRGAEIGMIFQEPMTALNPLRTIGDQVAETIRIHGKASRRAARERAEQVLSRVGLAPGRVSPDRYPHELSGGQRQRVCIAMAVALKPKLLIADEPTTALDVTTQAQVLDLLRQLVAEDNMALMLITHDLAVVADMTDDLLIMRHGQVVERGRLRDLAHPYSKHLLEASQHQPDRSGQAVEPGPLLEVCEVVRDYSAGSGALRAVDQVSFAIRRGESVGLVGESGCGKSTLTRAILGLEPLQGGEIRLDGAVIDARAGVGRAVRRRMQTVFQDPYGSFNPRHRVARLVAEPLHLLEAPLSRADRDTAIDEALMAVGLSPSDKHKFIHQFSGGQRQRIAIARALILRPDLIVLDEAVSALDVSIRAQILDLLADLGTRFGLTYLFISHDLSVVQSVTDRVLVMRAGQIVEAGPTETVFANPQHPYTRELLAAAPRLPQEVVPC